MAKKSNETEDLLDSIPDEVGEPWIAEEEGDSIAGVVIDVYDVKDDFDDKARVPVIVIKTDDDEIFNIAGYRSGLRQEINRRMPIEIGGLFAVKFMGEVPVKKGKFAGKPFFAYKTAYRAPTQLKGET